MEDELTQVPFALPVQPLEAAAWPMGYPGLILSGIISVTPSELPLLPPATTHLRLPPSLGWRLYHIPPGLGLEY